MIPFLRRGSLWRSRRHRLHPGRDRIIKRRGGRKAGGSKQPSRLLNPDNSFILKCLPFPLDSRIDGTSITGEKESATGRRGNIDDAGGCRVDLVRGVLRFDKHREPLFAPVTHLESQERIGVRKLGLGRIDVVGFRNPFEVWSCVDTTGMFVKKLSPIITPGNPGQMSVPEGDKPLTKKLASF